MPTQTTPTGPQTQLVNSCRELTDHLSAYAISAGHFDEEAFMACERAERLLFDARRSDCCSRRVDEINDFDVCRGCGRICSDEQ